MGEGLVVYKAVANRNNNMSIEDNAKRIEENLLNFCHSPDGRESWRGSMH